MGAEVRGTMILLNADQGKYIGLDEIGTEIWKRTESAIGVDALCSELLDKFDTELETVRRDVLKFLNEMHALGLIDILP